MRAASVLRARDPDNRITIISIGGLLFYDRYQLPQVFAGKRDWRAYLVHPPELLRAERRIAVRRKCRVTQVDPRRRVLMLAHREEVGYDTLLIASGGGGYLPATLIEYRPLFNAFRHLPRRDRDGAPLCPRAAPRSCSAATSWASTSPSNGRRPAIG